MERKRERERERERERGGRGSGEGEKEREEGVGREDEGRREEGGENDSIIIATLSSYWITGPGNISLQNRLVECNHLLFLSLPNGLTKLLTVSTTDKTVALGLSQDQHCLQ